MLLENRIPEVHELEPIDHDLIEGLGNATDTLGPGWTGYDEIRALIDAYRNKIADVLLPSKLNCHVIGVVGHNKAGKSWLVSVLTGAEGKNGVIKSGPALDDATCEPAWVIPEGIEERHIPSYGEVNRVTALPDIGISYILVDVPGMTATQNGRREAADRALAQCSVKILIWKWDEPDPAIYDYLAQGDGAVILPVPNECPDDGEKVRKEVQKFLSGIPQVAPNATIEEPIYSLFLPKARWLVGRRSIRLEVISRLKNICARFTPTETQVKAEGLSKDEFRTAVAAMASRSLGGMRIPYNTLVDEEERLVEELKNLVGEAPLVRTGIRQQMRVLMLERTSVAAFPWRGMFALAHYTWGAADRLLMACSGSLPSLIGTVVSAVRNRKTEKEFSAFQTGALKARAEALLNDKVRPHVETLQEEYDNAMGVESEERRTASLRPDLELHGLDLLQLKSAELFSTCASAAAPKHPNRFGVLGCVIFWGLFIWPLVALYIDYLAGITSMWSSAGSRVAAFPAGTAGVLFTAGVLSLIPMFVLLLAYVGWSTRASVIKNVEKEIRLAHEELISEMNAADQLLVKVRNHPKLDACLTLLRGGS